jgi:molybdopterin molybdotransferase
MLGLGAHPIPTTTATLGADLPANGPRAHYMRASISGGSVIPMDSQDSALLRILSEANTLIVRTPLAPAARSGNPIDIISL